MGFLSDVKKMREAVEAQPPDLSHKERTRRAEQALADEEQHELESKFAPGAEPVHIEVLDTRKVRASGIGDVVNAYIGMLGLRPEDTYGVWPSRLGGGADQIKAVAVAHRDKPEYEAGRERFYALVEEGL